MPIHDFKCNTYVCKSLVDNSSSHLTPTKLLDIRRSEKFPRISTKIWRCSTFYFEVSPFS